MKNFGEFLVENKYISDEDYIRSLIKQERSAPSVLESIVELNLLSFDMLIDNLSKSRSEKSTLSTMLSNENNKKIQEHRKKCAKSIAEIIHEDKILSSSELQTYSSEFLESSPESEKRSENLTSDEEVRSEKSVEVISSAALESLRELQGDDFDESLFSVESNSDDNDNDNDNDNVEISSAALESLKELQGDDFDISEITSENKESSDEEAMNNIQSHEVSEKSEFSQIYSLKKQNKILKIEKMIVKAIESESSVANYLNSLYRELHIIKGAASLSELSKFCKLIDIWEVMLDLLFKKEESFINDWAAKHISSIELTMNVLWEIRQKVDNGSSEAEIFEDKLIKESYINCITKLKSALSLVREG